jgi:hypothetical protein
VKVQVEQINDLDSIKKNDIEFLIDNFEDGNINFNPEWFQFGDANFSVINAKKYFNNSSFFNKVINLFIPNTKDAKFPKNIGQYILLCEGKTQNWYVGGMGTYLGIDARRYNAMSLYVYGFGKHSGRLKIELFDDDNNNWKIELDNNFQPLYDDLFIYELDVNWKGWRYIEIPFTKFKLENLGIGDSIWNPYQTDNSGGLIQLQLVSLSDKNKKSGSVKFVLDNLKFINNLALD